MVASYCFFEPVDILKCKTPPYLFIQLQHLAYERRCVPVFAVCFYVFDQDKTGFFSVDDLNNLVNAVHNIKGGSTVTGTVKASWMKLSFAGQEFEFEEFKRIHNAFPRLFQPAFSLQQSMMIGFMGERWWNAKKQYLADIKELADAKIKAVERKKEKKKERKKARKTQRAMGSLRYYLCPCMRKYYDPSLTQYDKLSEEEKAKRDEEIALARRQAELRVKNPETAVWLKYQKKIAKENQVYAIEEEEPEAQDAHPEGAAAGTVAAGAGTAGATGAAGATAAAGAAGNSAGAVSAMAAVTSMLAKPAAPPPPAPLVPIDTPYITPAIVATKKVVVNNYLDDKVKIATAVRAERAESRAERKARRDKDPDLKQKIRTTISGAEY
jgi:hypothetical protein